MDQEGHLIGMYNSQAEVQKANSQRAIPESQPRDEQESRQSGARGASDKLLDRDEASNEEDARVYMGAGPGDEEEFVLDSVDVGSGTLLISMLVGAITRG